MEGMGNVAVISDRLLGLALSGVFEKHGYHVQLCTDTKNQRVWQGNTFKLSGDYKGTFSPNVTTHAGTAILGSKTIVIAVPMCKYDDVLDHLVQHNLSNHNIVVFGSCFALRARTKFNVQSFLPNIFETTTDEPFHVGLKGRNISIVETKIKLVFAASKTLDKKIGPIVDLFPYPTIIRSQSLASIFFSHIQPLSYAAALLADQHRIEAEGEKLCFYQDCAAPAIEDILGLNGERLAIAEKLGVVTDDALTIYLQLYGHRRTTLLDFFAGFDGYSPAPHPTHAALHTNVGCFLVLMYYLGAMVGVDTPVMKRIITDAGTIVGKDFFKEGWTLESLGLKGATEQQVLEALGGAPRHTGTILRWS